MKLNIGTKNIVKIEAVTETISNYDFLKNATIECCEVESGVSSQPKTLEETIRGAQNRAQKAFINCDLSIGMESGITPVPYTKTGYMNFCICAIFDGQDFYLGSSSGFEYPKSVMKLVLEKGLEISDAFLKAGLTKSKHIGSTEGAIGLLTKGRFTRKDLTKQSIVNALIYLENKMLQ